MLDRGNRAASLIANSSMSWLIRFAKKVLSNLFYCGQHLINQAVFQIVAGERRWRAAQVAQLHEIPAVVRDLSDAECFEIALIENIQRQDLSVIDEAQGYANLKSIAILKNNYLGLLENGHIANLLRVWLPAPIQHTRYAMTN